MLATLAVCLLIACGESDDDKKPGSPQPNSPTSSDSRTHSSSGESWTVLVYMVADNNLEPFALDDLIEMAAVGSGQNLNIVVQIDRAEGYSEDGLGNIPNWTTTKRLRVMPGALEHLSDLGEVNMGATSTLSDFISWGAKTYPADRYALIFWDHGGSWPGFGGDDSTVGMDVLSVAELKSGIQNGMRAGGVEQFALIGFDACLMATYEVALALRPFGEYLLASEQLEPGHGWDWRALQVLKTDTRSSPLTLGQRIIQGFKAQAETEQTAGDITLSLTDLYALDDLEAGVTQLASAFPSGNDVVQATAIGRGRVAALEFGEFPNPSQSLNMVDLGDLADQIATQSAQASAARTAIRAALAKAVVARTSGPQMQRATGLSIYFPTVKAFYKSDYDALVEMRPWRDFLNRLLQGASSVPPSFLNETAQIIQSTDGVTFRGQLSNGAADVITSASLYYGYSLSDGSLVVLGDRPARVVTGSPAYVEGSWNLTALYLSQGTTRSAYAYLAVAAAQGGQVSAVIPFAYLQSSTANAQLAFRILLIDSVGSVTQDTYFLQSEGGLGELFPVQGSLLIPLVQVVTSEGSRFDVVTDGDARFDPTQPISIQFRRLASGTQGFGLLSIEDFSGQGDQAFNFLVMP